MGVKKETILPGDGKSVLRGPFHEALEALQYPTLMNGNKFDSSRDRGKPFQFNIGKGQVIRGLDEGIMQMSVGERAKLTVTSDYAYGKEGYLPIIPPNADLVFDVKLIAIS